MGYKRTRDVARAQAEELYALLELRSRQGRAKFAAMSNRELEDALDRISDEVAEFEGVANFDSFCVTP